MTDSLALRFGARRTFPRSVALAIAGLTVGALAVGCGQEDAGATAVESSTTADPTPSASAAEDPSASGTPADEGATGSIEEPSMSPVVLKAVRPAMKAGFPALVPTSTPTGWTVTRASYAAQRGGSWRIELEDADGGPVTLVQTSARLRGLLATTLGKGATAAGKVDLTASGLGVWDVYQSNRGTGIATTLPSTSALVVARDPDTAAELATMLLTAEDAGLPEGG